MIAASATVAPVAGAAPAHSTSAPDAMHAAAPVHPKALPWVRSIRENFQAAADRLEKVLQGPEVLMPASFLLPSNQLNNAYTAFVALTATLDVTGGAAPPSSLRTRARLAALEASNLTQIDGMIDAKPGLKIHDRLSENLRISQLVERARRTALEGAELVQLAYPDA